MNVSHLGHTQLKTDQLHMQIQGHHIDSPSTSQFHGTNLSNLTHSLGSLCNAKNMSIDIHCALEVTQNQKERN